MKKIITLSFCFILAAIISFVLPSLFTAPKTTLDPLGSNRIIYQRVIETTEKPVDVIKAYYENKEIGVITNKDYLDKLNANYYHEVYESDFPNSKAGYVDDVYFKKESVFSVFENKDAEIFNFLRDNDLLAIKTNKFIFSVKGERYAEIYVNDSNDFYDGRNKFLKNFISEESLEIFNEGGVPAELQTIGYRETSISIKEDISQSEAFANPKYIINSMDEVFEYFCYGDNKNREYYEVQEGQTLEGVSYFNENMTPEILVMINPDRLSSPTQILEPGMILNVTYYTSPITVYVTKEHLQEEVIYPDNALVIYDETLDRGTEIQEVEEERGSKNVLYDEVYINGVMQPSLSKEKSETVTKEPVQGVIRTGSKQVSGYGTGIFRWPLDTFRVTCKMNCYFYQDHWHAGTDIQDPYNPYGECKAADNGIVEKKSYDNASGYYVLIDHQNGYKTWYGHLNVPAYVEEGEAVYKGQVIGQVGMSGRATGPHVHFEIWYGGAKLDACKILGC